MTARLREGLTISRWVKSADARRWARKDHTSVVRFVQNGFYGLASVTRGRIGNPLPKLDMPDDQGPRMGGTFVGEKGKLEISRNLGEDNFPILVRLLRDMRLFSASHFVHLRRG